MKKLLRLQARIFRILSLPPLVVASFLALLFFTGYPVRLPLKQVLFALFFLAFFPLLAYPVSLLKAAWHPRDVQRRIAFLFSGIGYLSGTVLGMVMHLNRLLIRLLIIYLISFLILLSLQRLGTVRPSGHACSITGPLIFCILFYGESWKIPVLLIYLAVLWSSVYLKRHTVREFLLGSLTSALPALLLMQV